jgi:hypothetical protein
MIKMAEIGECFGKTCSEVFTRNTVELDYQGLWVGELWGDLNLLRHTVCNAILYIARRCKESKITISQRMEPLDRSCNQLIFTIESTANLSLKKLQSLSDILSLFLYLECKQRFVA